MKHNKRIHKTTGDKHSTSVRVLSCNGDVHGRVVESNQKMIGPVIDYIPDSWKLFTPFPDADYIEVRFDGQKYEATGKWYKIVYDVLPDGKKSKRLVTQKV